MKHLTYSITYSLELILLKSSDVKVTSFVLVLIPIHIHMEDTNSTKISGEYSNRCLHCVQVSNRHTIHFKELLIQIHLSQESLYCSKKLLFIVETFLTRKVLLLYSAEILTLQVLRSISRCLFSCSSNSLSFCTNCLICSGYSCASRNSTSKNKIIVLKNKFFHCGQHLRNYGYI